MEGGSGEGEDPAWVRSMWRLTISNVHHLEALRRCCLADGKRLLQCGQPGPSDVYLYLLSTQDKLKIVSLRIQIGIGRHFVGSGLVAPLSLHNCPGAVTTRV